MGKELAECVGLWLAEGDRKSHRELTFTNNCTELVELFHKTVNESFFVNNQPRIYGYAPTGCEDTFEIEGVAKKHYVDERANRPYYVYRISGVGLLETWLATVQEMSSNKGVYADILRGFFAGEGSVKFQPKWHSRIIRIAQGQRHALIETILDFFGVTYAYRQNNRTYEISGVENLKKLESIKLTELHPEKHRRFKVIMKSYIQPPQARGIGLRKVKETKAEISGWLKRPMTCEAISKKLGRTLEHTQQALIELRKEGKAERFKADGTFFWVKADSKLVVVSKRKKLILSRLGRKRTASELAAELGGSERAVRKKLEELARLGLVEKHNKYWCANRRTDKMIIAGVDEAGRKPA